MTPLVIGLAIVVVVILIAVAVGMRRVRNTERADFADPPAPAGRGAARGRPAQGQARGGQRPRPVREAAPGRAAVSGRDGRRYDSATTTRGHDSRDYASRGYDDRGYDDRGHDDGHDEPDFRTAQRQEARGRQVRGRRDDDGDWPSTEWDKLSDADYWKEVASDRPLVTTARVAQPAQDARPARDLDDAGQVAQPARRAAEPRAAEPRAAGDDFLAAPAVARSQQPARPEPARPWPARPADDDPLTSPSFPKIVTSDSRSYHSGRAAAAAPGPADPAGYGEPTTQFASYGAGPARPAGGRGANGYDGSLTDTSSATTAPRSYRPDALPGYQPDARPGYRPDSQPGSYGTRSRAADARPAAQQAGLSQPPMPSPPAMPPAPGQLTAAASPAGNPYGSYVSADLPGYEDLPLSGYQPGHSGNGFPGPPAGQENGHRGSKHRQGPQAGVSALPPDSRAGGWYPGMPAAMAPVSAPAGPAPLSRPGLPDAPEMPGYANGQVNENGNGHLSPSGYSPAPCPAAPYPAAPYPAAPYPAAPYPGNHDDVPGYPTAGYGPGPEAPGYRSAGRHSAGRQDPAGYLPPEYGRDGYGGR